MSVDGRRGEGEEMAKQEWQAGLTDFRTKKQGTIMVVEVVKPRNDFSRAELQRAEPYRLAEIYRDLIDFSSMEHVGTLTAVSNGRDTFELKDLTFESCGGEIGHTQVSNETNLSVGCSNCALYMNANSGDGEIWPMIEDYMFQLMLKQMCPDIDGIGAGYIDCAAFAGCSERAQAVREVGLISASQFFSRVIVTEGRDLWPRVGLGFTLMPGTRTRNSCDGFDNWLRFLVGKKLERDKEVLRDFYNQARSRILGPKAPC